MFRLGFFHFTFYFCRYYIFAVYSSAFDSFRLDPSSAQCWSHLLYLMSPTMMRCCAMFLRTATISPYQCRKENLVRWVGMRKETTLFAYINQWPRILLLVPMTTYSIHSITSYRKISWKFFFALDSFSFSIWFFKGNEEPSPSVWHISNWYLTSMMKWMPINCLQTKALTNVWIHKMYNRVCVYAWIHFSWMYSLRFIRFVLWTIW